MIQKGNYELSFRRIKEESTNGFGSVCYVGFYVISYVLGVCSFGGLLLPVAKDRMHC